MHPPRRMPTRRQPCRARSPPLDILTNQKVHLILAQSRRGRHREGDPQPLDDLSPQISIELGSGPSRVHDCHEFGTKNS